jgi:hypothetical protein
MLTAVVLLVLTGHAFIVSASHFHRVRQPTTAASAGEVQVGRPASAQSAPLAGGHEQCLLCRLQRNLVADLQHAAPMPVAPRAVALDPDRRFDAHVRQPALLAPSGRAPPSA